ncbi:MAG: iron ABC transporter permease [Deltaproteobacteria bacterium]|nr:iron ABC transporter permease [Deltaproteobacteria bacterium]
MTAATGARRHFALTENLIGYGTILLILGVLVAFLIAPVAVILVKAFRGPDGFTLEYFQLLFQNELHMEATVNSLALGLVTVLATTVIALPLALVNAKLEFPGKTLLTGLLLMPMVMPPFVGAIGIQRFFARRGVVNLFLMEFGLTDAPIEWLEGSRIFWAVALLEALHLYPILYLNLTSALANIDPSLDDVADTLGVSKWKRLKDITWPLARPGYFAGAIIVFIWAFTDLGTPLLVGYQQALPVRIFNMISDVNENPMGFALVVLVIVMTLVIFFVSKLALSGRKYEMMARGHVTNRVQKLNFVGALPCYLLLGFVILLAVTPHLSVALTSFSDNWFMTILPEHYTLEHYHQVLATELPMIGIKNSLLFSGLSTLVDLFLGVLVAYVIARKIVPFTGLLEGVTMMPLALPGIVLAFGYVVTFTGTPLDPFINPMTLLIIAYAIRRLPYMVRAATAGLMQTSRSLEEASMVFGASRFMTLRRITVPLIAANLVAGCLLCFAYAMLDVSDSLILAMKDQYYPLTKAIYALFLEQGSGELTASALGVLGMILLAICLLGASRVLGKKMGELFRS